MENAGASVDGGDESQARQHGQVSIFCLGLGRRAATCCHLMNEERKETEAFYTVLLHIYGAVDIRIRITRVLQRDWATKLNELGQQIMRSSR